MLNLLGGERGLISYYEKQKIKDQLFQEKKSLIIQLNLLEKKINLLTGKVNLDYIEMLYREKFLLGKPNEKIYINIDETKTSRKN